MTNADIIKDALNLIGVLRIRQTPDAGQSEQALRAMNDMFFEWQALGIDLGYTSQSVVTDPFPLDETLHQLTKANLALRLCAAYEKQPSAVVVGMAQTSYERVLRDSAIAERVESESALGRGAANNYAPFRYFN